MSFSTVFIHRPVATMLLTLGVALAGALSFTQLPVAPLPQVDFPTISVTASLPGANNIEKEDNVPAKISQERREVEDVRSRTSP